MADAAMEHFLDQCDVCGHRPTGRKVSPSLAARPVRKCVSFWDLVFWWDDDGPRVCHWCAMRTFGYGARRAS